MGTTGVVVPAAGRGTRLGSRQNKIWVEIHGRSILGWTLAALDTHPEIDHIVVAGAPDELERLLLAAGCFPKLAGVVPGGNSRAESVRNGLRALPAGCELALVHDAARPAVSHALISRVLAEVRRSGAAVPALPVADTLKRGDSCGAIEATVARANLWAAQTPQGARLQLLLDACEELGDRIADCTDESSILEAVGTPVRLVEGEESNRKITRRSDIDAVAAVLGTNVNERGFHPAVCRTGFGYDVHALAADRPLWLGGVNIPHPFGLAGHSDADVVLHAVCDALLGAAGLGDIGLLFPDTDAANRGRPSIEFLTEVNRLLVAAGWSVVNVDVALLAEEPRIGPYRQRMVDAISGCLGIHGAQVNVKATTAERMGFVGRREGIACWAIATISGAS